MSDTSELPSSKDLTPYHFLCLAVGSLFLNWAEFENGLTAGLKVHLVNRIRHNDKKERAAAARVVAAIYGGLRMKTSRDIMKRLAKVEGIDQEARDFFDASFAHIGHIEDLRDKIAHQALEPTQQEHVWQLHDLMTTKALAETRFYEFNTISINYAALDLREAGLRLSGFLDYNLRSDVEFDLTPIAWRYKPSMLKLLPQRTALSRQLPGRQPQSSGE